MTESLTQPVEQEMRAPGAGSPLEVLAVFGRLGLSSFGGPVAHLGYFRAEIVERRKWLDDQSYADLVALCQFLPGPASSQVGIGIGMMRAGLLGGLAAWIGFTLPSALLMIGFALGVSQLGQAAGLEWLHGLKIVAVAVVAQAVWGMARSLCPDRLRATLAIIAAMAVLLWPGGLVQLLFIALTGLVGVWLLQPHEPQPASQLPSPVGRRLATGAWLLFFGLLIGLPLLRQLSPSHSIALFDSFYRVGSLVFGGGHVILPLLQAEVVPPGWVSEAQFIAGYGAAQAIPGPLFTFSAYLGTIQAPQPNGPLGGLLALLAIFLPSWCLVLGAMPFWNKLRGLPAAQGALRGVNAGVVGVLLAALYDPVWTSGILGPADFALALACFGLLVFWKLPPWLVVLAGGLAGALLATAG